MNCPPVTPVAANVSLDNFKTRIQDFIADVNSFLQDSEELGTMSAQELQTVLSTGKRLLCEDEDLGNAVGDLYDYGTNIAEVMPEEYDVAQTLNYHIQMRVDSIEDAIEEQTHASATGGSRKKAKKSRKVKKTRKSRKVKKTRKGRKTKGKIEDSMWQIR